MDTYADRLAIAINGMPLKDVYEQTGVTVGAIRSYLKGTEPKLSNHVALSRGLGISETWLSTGEGVMLLDDPGSLICVPYLSVSVLSENQRVWHKKKYAHMSHVKVSRRWVYEELDVETPQNLRWVYVDSDAMGPSLRKGNLVLLNLCIDNHPSTEGIVGICLDGSLIFRRIQPADQGLVLLTAESSNYKSIELSLDEISTGENCHPDKITIIGTVIYICHRI